MKENRNIRKDAVDSLLELGAKQAGSEDIAEFKAENENAELSPQMLESIKNATESEKKRKRVHLSFRQRLLVAVVAMLTVGIVAVSVIAGMKSESAAVNDQYVSGVRKITYDMSGIKSRNSLPDTNKAPSELPEGFKQVSRKGDKKGYTIMYSNGESKIEFTVSPLNEDYFYEIEVGNTREYRPYGVHIAEDYNGIVAGPENDSTKPSVVLWNDGKRAYMLRGVIDLDELIAVANSVHE